MFWRGKKDKTLFGWIDRSPRGYDQLELSLHSRAALARENTQRIISEWQQYFAEAEGALQ